MDLEKLSINELKHLRDKIDFILKVRKPKTSSTNPELLYDIISLTIRNKIFHNYPSYGIFKIKNPTLHKKLLQSTDFLDNYFETLTDNTMKQDRVKFYSLFSDIVSDYILKESNLELSLTMVLNFTEKFPSLLNKAFPGYLQSGLIDLILSDEEIPSEKP